MTETELSMSSAGWNDVIAKEPEMSDRHVPSIFTVQSKSKIPYIELLNNGDFKLINYLKVYIFYSSTLKIYFEKKTWKARFKYWIFGQVSIPGPSLAVKKDLLQIPKPWPWATVWLFPPVFPTPWGAANAPM